MRDASPVRDHSYSGPSRTSVRISACNLDRSSGSNGGGEAFCISRNIDCVICKRRADTRSDPPREDSRIKPLREPAPSRQAQDCRERAGDLGGRRGGCAEPKHLRGATSPCPRLPGRSERLSQAVVATRSSRRPVTFMRADTVGRQAKARGARRLSSASPSLTATVRDASRGYRLHAARSATVGMTETAGLVGRRHPLGDRQPRIRGQPAELA